jgi:hypothetical protein
MKSDCPEVCSQKSFVSEFTLSAHGMYCKLRAVDVALTLYIVYVHYNCFYKESDNFKPETPHQQFLSVP